MLSVPLFFEVDVTNSTNSIDFYVFSIFSSVVHCYGDFCNLNWISRVIVFWLPKGLKVAKVCEAKLSQKHGQRFVSMNVSAKMTIHVKVDVNKICRL